MSYQNYFNIDRIQKKNYPKNIEMQNSNDHAQSIEDHCRMLSIQCINFI